MNVGQNERDDSRPAGQSKSRRIRPSSAVLFLVVSTACFLILGVLVSDDQRFDRMTVFVERVRLGLMFARLALIGLAWWYWNPIVDWIYKGANQTGVAPLKAKRHFLALFFVVFELVVVQEGLAYFVMFAD